MGGELNLDTLLKSMNPELAEDPYVFAQFVNEILPGINYWALIKEDEGTTAILTVNEARRLGMEIHNTYGRITLKIHSSLDAVGLTAAIATALAKRSISANVVAGYYHDHFFVPSEKADEALEVLKELAKEG